MRTAVLLQKFLLHQPDQLSGRLRSWRSASLPLALHEVGIDRSLIVIRLMKMGFCMVELRDEFRCPD
jgi:hypothetical protein